MRSALVVAILSIAGCTSKGGNARPQECPKKDCPEADTDADFLHADRDQLAALCMASGLPRLPWAPDYAALTTADGKRLPWLLVWSVSDRPGDEPVLHPADWLTATKRAIERDARHRSEPPKDDTRSGHHWLNFLCDGDEWAKVVVTAALIDKTGSHAVAIRGSKVLDETLPAGAKDDEVFKRAIELTTKLVGQPMTLAKHSLGGTPPMFLDVADPWRAPLGLKP